LEEDGFALLGVMLEDNSGAQPDEDDLNSWADAYGIDHPMLADGQGANAAYIVSGYPTYVLIDRDMTIVTDDLWPFEASTVRALVNK